MEIYNHHQEDKYIETMEKYQSNGKVPQQKLTFSSQEFVFLWLDVCMIYNKHFLPLSMLDVSSDITIFSLV